MNAEHQAMAEHNDPSGAPSAASDAAAPARRRRPEPARTKPLRNAATLLRDNVPPSAAPDAQPAAAGDTSESPVARGVRLGYQVIEEQILQGQKLAQRLGRAAGKAAASVTGRAAGASAAPAAVSDAGAGEVQELLDRVVHLYKDMGALCVDAVDTLVHHPLLRSGLARMTPAAAPEPASAAAAVPATAPAAVNGAATDSGAGGNRFALDIRCSRRTQVTLDLPQRAGSFVPRVHALHAGDAALAPLTGVRFGTDEDSSAAVLQLDIADTQPAATYSGVVVDAATNQPRGTLSVRLLA